MGRIADNVDDSVTDVAVFTNKVDTILERLDDDEDRAVVLSWLLDPDVSDQAVEMRLRAHDIRCSDSTVRLWRRYQQAGMGRVWVV